MPLDNAGTRASRRFGSRNWVYSVAWSLGWTMVRKFRARCFFAPTRSLRRARHREAGVRQEASQWCTLAPPERRAYGNSHWQDPFGILKTHARSIVLTMPNAAAMNGATYQRICLYTCFLLLRAINPINPTPNSHRRAGNGTAAPPVVAPLDRRSEILCNALFCRAVESALTAGSEGAYSLLSRITDV